MKNLAILMNEELQRIKDLFGLEIPTSDPILKMKVDKYLSTITDSIEKKEEIPFNEFLDLQKLGSWLLTDLYYEKDFALYAAEKELAQNNDIIYGPFPEPKSYVTL